MTTDSYALPPGQDPIPGSYLRVEGTPGNVGFLTTYKGFWLVNGISGGWELLCPVTTKARLATHDELYISGAGLQLRHGDFRQQVETEDSYSGGLAHYVFVEEQKALDELVRVRSAMRRLLMMMSHELINVLGDRKHLKAEALVGVQGFNHQVLPLHNALRVAEEFRGLWRERSARIDKNKFPEGRTSGFPNLVALSESVGICPPTT
jgi:hypothetical protein